ncbi:hypothetical protein THAOC_30400, partial [Thalassiosira oceanica]
RDLLGNDISGNALSRAIFVGYKSEKAGEGLLLKLLRARQAPMKKGKNDRASSAAQERRQPAAAAGRFQYYFERQIATSAADNLASRLALRKDRRTIELDVKQPADHDGATPDARNRAATKLWTISSSTNYVAVSSISAVAVKPAVAQLISADISPAPNGTAELEIFP